MTGSQRTLLLALLPAAYVLGSVPFGLIVGKWRGVDPRTAGSGNIGATNVGRLLGKRFFFLVFLLDMMKGLVPMVVAGSILAGTASHDRLAYVLWLLIGFATIAGHMFSIFLGFKGGKGVATSCGVVLGLVPYFTIPALIGLGVFIVVFWPTRYVSLGSIVAAASFPIIYFVIASARGWDPLGAQLPLMIFAILMAAMIIFRHRSNIARLRAGTESKFSSSKKPG